MDCLFCGLTIVDGGCDCTRLTDKVSEKTDLYYKCDYDSYYRHAPDRWIPPYDVDEERIKDN